MLAIPTDIHNQRVQWLSETFQACRSKRSVRVLSTHALLIELDLGQAFCAGAWVATIALACAAVEAKIRQIDTENYETVARKLFGSNAELQWLRDMRNEIMHAGAPGSKSKIWKASPNNLRACHDALEADARRAVTAMYRCLYG